MSQQAGFLFSCVLESNLGPRGRPREYELDEDVGLADGEEVEVTVKPAKPKRPWGDGIKRSAGVLADSWTKEDDRILEEIHDDRKRATRRAIPE